MVFNVSPEICKILSNQILKKEIPYGIKISMIFTNMFVGSFFVLINHLFNDIDTFKLITLKRIRQLYLIISVYVIVIHIEYIVWILTCVIVYIYAYVYLYLSEIISKKEIELYLDKSDTQSVQIDIASGNPVSITPIGTPLIQHTDQSTD